MDISYVNVINNDEPKLIEEWYNLTGYYKAIGGENIITIGVFFKNGISNRKKADFLDYVKKEQCILNKKDSKKFNNIIPEPLPTCFIDNVSILPVDVNGNEIILYPELLKDNNTIFQKEWHDIEDLEIEQAIILNNIYFNLNEAKLQAESETELFKLHNLLEMNPNFIIEIHGHTDNTGSDEYNLQLSEERAKSVVNYLIENGISEERLSYKGFGRSKPLTDNKSEEGKAKNRRVEFVIIEK